MNIAVVGGGWAGLAAAIAATQRGHHVTVFEASRHWGGRARTLQLALPDGRQVDLDNGQHILIGAYTETLRLMRVVGLDPEGLLLRTPLDLRFADGTGLALPKLPAPLDAAVGILRAKGWTWRDKWSLLRASTRWQRSNFECAAHATVLDLCSTLTPNVVQTLIEPLCVSALNTPPENASGQVFLTVLRDSLFAAPGGSNLLLPRVPLGQLFPEQAALWLAEHGATMLLGQRVESLETTASEGSAGWSINGNRFDRVIWATHPSAASHALQACHGVVEESVAPSVQQWAASVGQLQHEAITTVYAWSATAALVRPMVSLQSGQAMSAGEGPSPAQFVFDRAQLGGPAGLLAFVVSASHGDAHLLEQQVVQQAQRQLGLALAPVKTVVEKRATFACTPATRRPAMDIAPGLLACGDYVEGPYPATLEGAMRSGLAAGARASN